MPKPRKNPSKKPYKAKNEGALFIFNVFIPVSLRSLNHATLAENLTLHPLSPVNGSSILYHIIPGYLAASFADNYCIMTGDLFSVLFKAVHKFLEFPYNRREQNTNWDQGRSQTNTCYK